MVFLPFLIFIIFRNFEKLYIITNRNIKKSKIHLGVGPPPFALASAALLTFALMFYFYGIKSFCPIDCAACVCLCDL